MQTWSDPNQASSRGTSSAQLALLDAPSPTASTPLAKSSSSSVEAAVTSIRSPGGEAAMTLSRSPVAVAALVAAGVVAASMVATVAGTLLVLLRDYPSLILLGLIAAYIRWGRP